MLPAYELVTTTAWEKMNMMVLTCRGVNRQSMPDADPVSGNTSHAVHAEKLALQDGKFRPQPQRFSYMETHTRLH